MGAELGVLSRQKSSKPNQNPTYSKYQPNHHSGSWMWNTKKVRDDDDSWEVRAFAEDTGSILGATWPPRSYTCTFCRREFRSAQALGGHMNVHRRDRARLHQAQSPAASVTSSPSSSPSTFIYPNQGFPATSGVCYLYQIPNPNGVFSPTSLNPFESSPSSTLLSISPYSGRNRNNFLGKSLNLPVVPSPESSPHHLDSSNVDFSAIIDKSKTNIVNSSNNNKRKDLANDPEPELDLELRLGHRSRKAMIWPDRR